MASPRGRHLSRKFCTAFCLFVFIFLKSTFAADYNITARTSSSPGSAFFNIEDGGYIPENSWGFRYYATFEKDPLVLTDSSGNRILNVVSERYYSEMMAGKSFGFLDIGAAVPLIFQNGIDWPIAGVTSIAAGGVGDLRMFLKTRLLGDKNATTSLHASWDMTFPTSTVDFAKNRSLTGRPQLIFKAVFSYFEMILNAGVLLREATTFANTRIGNAMSLAGGLKISNPWLTDWTLTGEINSESASYHVGDSRNAVFASAGLRYRFTDEFFLSGGYGHSVKRGFAGPNQSGILLFTYAPLKTTSLREIKLSQGLTTSGNQFVSDPEITFLPDSDELEPKSIPSVKKLAETIQLNSNIESIAIEVSADWNESAASSLQLAHRRAQALQKSLIAAGVKPEKIKATGILPYHGANHASANPIKISYTLSREP